jgi:hypothetical protein
MTDMGTAGVAAGVAQVTVAEAATVTVGQMEETVVFPGVTVMVIPLLATHSVAVSQASQKG